VCSIRDSAPPARRATIAGKLATFSGERKVSINIALPAFAMMPGPASPLRYPKFSNDDGSEEIYVAVKQFECIGASPPHDHPHIYLDMGEDETILCPYCATRFWFIPPPAGLHTERGWAFIDGEDARAKRSRIEVTATALDDALSEGWPVSVP
jgi:uncharacterized Zn-finger protein